MSVFVDANMLLAAALPADRNHARAAAILEEVAEERPFTTDHVVVESWAVLCHRRGHHRANTFWFSLRETPLVVESVGTADLERAQAIAQLWADHDFDLVDCTSFAVMERLGCTRAATFDHDFAVYRYGAGRRRAFEIVT